MKISHNYYVYIVECKDKSYYTGITNNLERRLEEHNSGIEPKCYTCPGRPVKLKYYQHFHDVRTAIEWEKQLKGCSRKKKEALLKNDWKQIKKLSRPKNHPSTSSG